MDCLSPEQMARYLRGGGNGESRAVEDHVRDCPACAMQLLLARETLHELKARAARPSTERLRLPRRRSGSWVPWAAAAAVALFAIVAFALRPSPSVKRDPAFAKPPQGPAAPKDHVVVVPEKPVETPPKPDPRPVPEPPKPRPEPKIEVPAPKVDPKPSPDPVKPPEPPKPDPGPRKPAPTIAPRAMVARVTHTDGGTAAGKEIFAGDTLATGRKEFVAVAFDGYGSLYFRENSKAELGANGEINLIDGEMFAKIDSGRRLGALKTPAAEIEVHAGMFGLQVTKAQTEISVVDGSVAVGSVVGKGPSALIARAGKAAESRPLDPGYLTWLPEKLAAKKFGGWYEGESFTAFQGFRAMEYPQSFGGRAAVQVSEQGTAVLRSPLPFKGRHAVWLRVRAHEAKATTLGLHVNGQTLGEAKVEWAEGKAWRWVGPLIVNSDRLDLVVTALSRFPLTTNERNSFPVVIDAVWATTDAKAAPERLPEERRAYDLVLEEPLK